MGDGDWTGLITLGVRLTGCAGGGGDPAERGDIGLLSKDRPPSPPIVGAPFGWGDTEFPGPPNIDTKSSKGFADVPDIKLDAAGVVVKEVAARPDG